MLPKEEAESIYFSNQEAFRTKNQVHTLEWLTDGAGDRRLLSINKIPTLKAAEYDSIAQKHEDTSLKAQKDKGYRLLRVLVADDNAVNIKLIQKVLDKLGHSVAIVENGKEALEALAHEKFDVVLMDVEMPVMDGYIGKPVDILTVNDNILEVHPPAQGLAYCS